MQTSNRRISELALPAGRDILISARRYTDASFAHKEREKLWPRVWQVVCRHEDVPNVGDYLEYELGDQSILVVRVEPETIKAYHNVCLHRGTRLKRGSGTAKDLRCMFHAWCWNLNGTNKEITDAHDFPGLNPATLNLAECRVSCWGGFVFLNMDLNCEPLEAFLGPVTQRFAGFKLEELRVQSWRRAILPCNWKVPIDNFNESYHVLGLHPQQLPFVDDTNVVYEVIGNHSYEHCSMGVASARLKGTVDEEETWAVMMEGVASTFYQGNVEKRGEIAALSLNLPAGKSAREALCDLKRKRLHGLGIDTSSYTDSQLIDGHGLHLFPNTVMHLNFGEAFITRTRPNGLDPDSCITDIINLDFSAPGDAKGRVKVEEIPEPLKHDWGQVIGQDMSCFREVQAGLHSRGFPGIRLAQYQEQRINHMHQILGEYVDD